MRKWLARLEGTIYWPHYEWQINSKPIEIKDVIAATISSYQQLLGVPVNKDFDIGKVKWISGEILTHFELKPIFVAQKLAKHFKGNLSK